MSATEPAKATRPFQKHGTRPSKTASGKFSRHPNGHAYPLSPEALQTCREKLPATTKTVSDVYGGPNLYGFVGNDAVNNWDYLGLDEKRQGQERVRSDLSYLKNELQKLMVGRDSSLGYVNAIEKLERLKGFRVEITDDFPSGAAGQYDGLSNKLRLPTQVALNQDTTAHELVHYYNDIHNTFGPEFSKDRRRDEGMAYGLEQQINDVITYIKVIEIGLNGKQLPCSIVRENTYKSWRKFWGNYHPQNGAKGYYRLPPNPIRKLLGESSRREFHLDETDYDNVKTHFGMRHSCSKILKILSKLPNYERCDICLSCGPDPRKPNRFYGPGWDYFKSME